VSQLLDDLAAKTPAPGGGWAAAWTAAMAAALVEMAAAFSDRSVEQARALRAEALALGERDLTAYQPVLDAMRLPKDDPGRADQIEAAKRAAAETPREIARVAGEVAGLAEELVADGNPHLEGDANAGLVLARAAREAAERLVEINLR
jgi:formiminotetrahydrofolate cyclodeaminase